ncbi:MAG: hypothetical protein B6I37_06285 [Desulfobacteraceae bacterium 4572_35.2]|nr:MAG: hypothetical protein B6I37_06285 [Desulfobacteraceae bacterium 4572_35.2]
MNHDLNDLSIAHRQQVGEPEQPNGLSLEFALNLIVALKDRHEQPVATDNLTEQNLVDYPVGQHLPIDWLTTYREL